MNHENQLLDLPVTLTTIPHLGVYVREYLGCDEHKFRPSCKKRRKHVEGLQVTYSLPRAGHYLKS